MKREEIFLFFFCNKKKLAFFFVNFKLFNTIGYRYRARRQVFQIVWFIFGANLFRALRFSAYMYDERSELDREQKLLRSKQSVPKERGWQTATAAVHRRKSRSS